MPDLAQTQHFPFVCEGGLISNRSTFIMRAGEALQLENFEPDVEGGYRRISGFKKHIRSIVPHTTATSEEVLLDISKKFEPYFDEDSITVLIQPTTPFIDGNDIDLCIKKLINNTNKNTCISVKKVSEYPEWMITQKDGFSDIGVTENIIGLKGVRQTLTQRWIPNGGIYAIRTSFLLKFEKYIEDETLVYEMPKLVSLDIDDEEDDTNFE